MASFREVAQTAIDLMDEMVSSVPSSARGAFSRRVLAIKDTHSTATHERVFQSGGARAYWEKFRSERQFSVDVRGEDSFVITGWDNLKTYLNWSERTLKSRLAMGRGVINIVRPEGDREQIVTITRIDK